MKICTWNIHNSARKETWEYLIEINPDIALLQEVNSVPKYIKRQYDLEFRRSIKKDGSLQKFGTAILVKGEILSPLELITQWEWVNELIELFSGNLLTSKVKLNNGLKLNLYSVYSPPWPIPKDNLNGIDISDIKLKNNPQLWVTELLWASLIEREKNDPWIVGGDLNASVTFDTMWGKKPRGNQELLDRMKESGFIEALFKYNRKLIPTFKHSRKSVIHQMDHLFIEKKLQDKLISCNVGSADLVFGENLSDHLPIIANVEE